MKIHLELDMTPDEARRVMGLPDVSGMQKRLVQEMERRMLEAMDTAADPEALLKTWFQWGSQGIEQFQRFMLETAEKASGRR